MTIGPMNRHHPPYCGHMYREVVPPCPRWPARVGRVALRLVAGVALALAGAQWGMGVARRECVVRTLYEPVPTLCEDRPGMWRRCPWVGDERYVDHQREPLLVDHWPTPP